MKQALQIAPDTLLEPTGLQVRDIDKLFNRLMERDIDYADIYFQHSRSESWVLEDGIVKSGSKNIDQGVGIRAISGEKTGFAYSDEFNLSALAKAADAANQAANDNKSNVTIQQNDNRQNQSTEQKRTRS